MDFQFEPILDRIFVADYGQPDMSPGGIIIPDDKAQFYRYRSSDWRFGEVLAVGPGRYGGDGQRMLMPDVEIGDCVMFSRKFGSRLPGDIRYEHPKYGALLVRVLDSTKCTAVVRGFDPWWNVQLSQLDPSGMMSG